MTKKILTLLTVFFVLLMTSCSDSGSPIDDNSEIYPIALKYTSIEDLDFKLYVGSETGTQDISASNINPEEFWKKHLYEDYDGEDYETMTITFTSKTDIVIKIGSKSFLGTYRFDNGQLYVKSDEEEEYFGDGDINNLKVYDSPYFYSKKDTDGSGFGTGYFDIKVSLDNLFKELDHSSIKSLDDIKVVGDTLAWQNRYYQYSK